MTSVTSIETVGDAHVVTLQRRDRCVHRPLPARRPACARRGDGCTHRHRRPRSGDASWTRRRSARSSASSGGCGSETGSSGSWSRARPPHGSSSSQGSMPSSISTPTGRRRSAQRARKPKPRARAARARADLDVVRDRTDDREAHSVLAELLRAPLGHRFALEAGAVVLDDHLELVVVTQGQLDRDVALRRPRRRAGRRWRRPR